MTAAIEPLWLPLAAPAAGEIAVAGGKGASLARLQAAGLPVPAAFILTTAAYRRLIEANGLEARIAGTVSDVDADDPTTLDRAASALARLFATAALPDEVAAAIADGARELGAEAVAVRSSATAEDLADLSFAGQQDTVLDVHGRPQLEDAVRRCWTSLWNARAIGYRARNRVSSEGIALAVVVQRMVPADAAGVLFTADPLTGAHDRTVVNATWGLGETLVSGEVTPDVVVLDAYSGRVLEQSVADKTSMRVPAAGGTELVAVPDDRRRRAVLEPASISALWRIGRRIDELYGRPMDVEWALSSGQLAVLQARPITPGPADEWNDSLLGDFLWTSANLGEAVPDVMTPATWSLFRRFIHGAMQANFTAGHAPVGIIGGRLYMNLSLTATQASVIFMSRETLVGLLAQAFGHIPDDVDIPLVPVSRLRVLRELLPAAVALQLRVRRNMRQFQAFLAASPARAETLRQRVEAASTAAELRSRWPDVVGYLDQASRMLEAATRRDSGALLRVRRNLARVVSPSDVDLLLAGLSAGAGLASLDPLRGLQRLARGEIDRATYARRYGHRGPHEFEISTPRPAEDPAWIDRQLDALRTAPTDVETLLGRQQAASAAAWSRLAERFPRRVDALREQVDLAASAFRDREAARSEIIRAYWPPRAFFVRAGALLGLGDDVFLLAADELVAVLGGDRAPFASIRRRRATYARYAALPSYPVLIRGAFDPFAWVADPHRRSDLFDARRAVTPASFDADLVGFPGAPGIVEGRVRVLDRPERGGELQPGEVLVTTVTNVGWTPIFPRAAAIVTDVGAPLSHAAIVARELGIPAVVGTGNATMRLQTGDLVRVHGSQGSINIIESSRQRDPQDYEDH
jgi:pyruvate,water dikinase